MALDSNHQTVSALLQLAMHCSKQEGTVVELYVNDRVTLRKVVTHAYSQGMNELIGVYNLKQY